LAVAVSPPYEPAGTAAPLSASSVVTRPPPDWLPVERGVTPAGGVSAVDAESRCIQYEMTHEVVPATVTVGVVRLAVLVVCNVRANVATGSIADVPREATIIRLALAKGDTSMRT
jgi:hypothetical protein